MANQDKNKKGKKPATKLAKPTGQPGLPTYAHYQPAIAPVDLSPPAKKERN